MSGASVERAFAVGPPLGHFEARLAQVELLAARADPRARTEAARALVLARDGDHLVSVDRLATLSEGMGRPGP